MSPQTPNFRQTNGGIHITNVSTKDFDREKIHEHPKIFRGWFESQLKSRIALSRRRSYARLMVTPPSEVPSSKASIIAMRRRPNKKLDWK